MDFMPSPMQDKENSAHCKVENKCCEYGAEIKLAKVFVADIFVKRMDFLTLFLTKTPFPNPWNKNTASDSKTLELQLFWCIFSTAASQRFETQIKSFRSGSILIVYVGRESPQ